MRERPNRPSVAAFVPTNACRHVDVVISALGVHVQCLVLTSDNHDPQV